MLYNVFAECVNESIITGFVARRRRRRRRRRRCRRPSDKNTTIGDKDITPILSERVNPFSRTRHARSLMISVWTEQPAIAQGSWRVHCRSELKLLL